MFPYCTICGEYHEMTTGGCSGMTMYPSVGPNLRVIPLGERVLKEGHWWEWTPFGWRDVTRWIATAPPLRTLSDR
jgi:hypothetical protein